MTTTTMEHLPHDRYLKPAGGLPTPTRKDPWSFTMWHPAILFVEEREPQGQH